MKRILVITFFMALLAGMQSHTPLYGQINLGGRTVLQALTANTWDGKDNRSDISYFVKYSTTRKTGILKFDGKTETFDLGPYYLSNTIETTFDSSKVGKVANGKYIIVQNTMTGKPQVYEILEFYGNVLTYHYLGNPNARPVEYIASGTTARPTEPRPKPIPDGSGDDEPKDPT